MRDSGGALVDHLADESDVLVQVHEGTRSDDTIAVEGGHVLAFGFDGGIQATESHLTNAWWRPGGGAWIGGVCGT